MSSAISTFDLSKKFRHTEALDGLALEVPEGSIYGLVGPNGAGKTTTIKVLMNIFRATRGRSEVLGVDSRRLSPRELARIGYVSENQEMPEWMTVEYFLDYLSNFYPTWDKTLADELVRQLELPRGRKLKHLSRGMKMKAALASSLAYRPKLVVLDEPFTGLDALVRDELIQGLLVGAEGTTILISSHDLAEIESFASHIGYLEQGRLRFSEELETLSARFREIVVTLGSPSALPREWPATWLRPETTPAVVRFVDTAFDPERTAESVRRLFPEVRDMAVNAMPLRSIFVTLAKSGRAAAA
jgi:ABC-2 type transport system ATP-binding protein